jgi:ATP-dependent Clp protease ATP-binding subunit ClpA
MVVPYVSEEVLLDSERRSSEVLEFEQMLRSRIVGQDRAVRTIVNIYQICRAGMSMPGRPLGSLLFLGPTGSGKTHLVEAAAEILFGNPNAFIKIDCAEFQHSHEIAKLIGSPPGYIGHRETQPIICQEVIDQHQTENAPLTFVLFDEIEKANEALWQLLLGILDRATLSLGDGRKVDLSRCVIVMTSNLGAWEINKMMLGGIGFTSRRAQADGNVDELDQKIYRTATDAAKRRFSPEFMNRIDKIVVFRSLTGDQLNRVLDIELCSLQNRIIVSQPGRQFIFRCTASARELLLREGTDMKYGARPLKRAIERYVVHPLSNLIATGQIGLGDVIKVDVAAGESKLAFSKQNFPRTLAAMEKAAVSCSGAAGD